MRQHIAPASLAHVAAAFALLACGGPAATSDVGSGDAGAAADAIAPPSYVPPDDAAACAPGDPQRERYGTSCLCCHTGDFTVAGSVDLERAPVAWIEVSDAFGNRSVMAPDPYGNFLRHNPLVPPLQVKVSGPDGRERHMMSPAPHANCNECHRPGGAAPRIAGP